MILEEINKNLKKLSEEYGFGYELSVNPRKRSLGYMASIVDKESRDKILPSMGLDCVYYTKNYGRYDLNLLKTKLGRRILVNMVQQGDRR